MGEIMYLPYFVSPILRNRISTDFCAGVLFSVKFKRYIKIRPLYILPYVYTLIP